MKNILFLDMNYLEHTNLNTTSYQTLTGANWRYDISGTGYYSSTAHYCFNGKSEEGFLLFSDTSTGTIKFDLGITVTADVFAVLNHNISHGTIQISTNDSVWSNITTNPNPFVYAISSAVFLELTATATFRYIKLEPSLTVDSELPYVGQLVASTIKYRVTNQPSYFDIKEVPNENFVPLHDNRMRRTYRGSRMESNLAWDYAIGAGFGPIGSTSLTSNDFMNVTELAMQNKTFMYYPNGGAFSGYNNVASTYPVLYGYRAIDMFKAKVSSFNQYSFPIDGYNTIGSINMKIEEAW